MRIVDVADVEEVLLVLALYCHSSGRDALQFCFRLFNGEAENMDMVGVSCVN